MHPKTSCSCVYSLCSAPVRIRDMRRYASQTSHCLSGFGLAVRPSAPGHMRQAVQRSRERERGFPSGFPGPPNRGGCGLLGLQTGAKGQTGSGKEKAWAKNKGKAWPLRDLDLDFTLWQCWQCGQVKSSKAQGKGPGPPGTDFAFAALAPMLLDLVGSERSKSRPQIPIASCHQMLAKCKLLIQLALAALTDMFSKTRSGMQARLRLVASELPERSLDTSRHGEVRAYAFGRCWL